ncbi:3-hydroxyacyl-ACP dehydratase [Vibrio makurazakiensis]|uniref:ApeI family dehydratase n=1 Tax=Vibrio makurazakiensis TaxID=2910250 RepID=UPI003D1425EA
MQKRKPTLLAHQQSDQGVLLQLRVDEDILDFTGHFKAFPILPGVTQIDWAIHYANKFLNVPTGFKGMEVIKFQEPILPNSIISLDLMWDSEKQKLSFNYLSNDATREEPVVKHSSGKMKLGNKGE